MLFNTTNINKDTESNFRKFADDIKLKRVGDMLESRASTQTDCNNLEKYAGRRAVLFQGKQSPESLKVSPWITKAGLCRTRKPLCRKGPESTNKLKCALETEVFQILGRVSKIAVSPATQIIPPLYLIFRTSHMVFSV